MKPGAADRVFRRSVMENGHELLPPNRVEVPGEGAVCRVWVCVKPCSFPKSERLLLRWQFQHVFGTGRRIHTKHFVILHSPNRLGITRLGVVAGRKVGKATRRNRVKRLVREVFRLNKARFPRSSDVVIIAKPGSTELNYCSVNREISERLP